MLKKEIANTNQVPDYLKSYGNKGTDDITVAAAEPQLKIIHNQENLGNMGEFYTTDNETNHGDKITVNIVHQEEEWLLFGEVDGKDKVLKRSRTVGIWDDGSKMEEEETYKNKHFQFYVVIGDDPIPKKLSLKGSEKSKIARAILVTAQASGLPIFAKDYTFTTEIVKGKAFDYALLKHSIGGFVTKERAEFLNKIHDQLIAAKGKGNDEAKCSLEPMPNAQKPVMIDLD